MLQKCIRMWSQVRKFRWNERLTLKASSQPFCSHFILKLSSCMCNTHYVPTFQMWNVFVGCCRCRAAIWIGQIRRRKKKAHNNFSSVGVVVCVFLVHLLWAVIGFSRNILTKHRNLQLNSMNSPSIFKHSLKYFDDKDTSFMHKTPQLMNRKCTHLHHHPAQK